MKLLPCPWRCADRKEKRDLWVCVSCFLISMSSAVMSVWRGRRVPTFSSAAVKATCATRGFCMPLKRPHRATRSIQPPTVCTVQHVRTHSNIPLKMTVSVCLCSSHTYSWFPLVSVILHLKYRNCEQKALKAAVSEVLSTSCVYFVIS